MKKHGEAAANVCSEECQKTKTFTARHALLRITLCFILYITTTWCMQMHSYFFYWNNLLLSTVLGQICKTVVYSKQRYTNYSLVVIKTDLLMLVIPIIPSYTGNLWTLQNSMHQIISFHIWNSFMVSQISVFFNILDAYTHTHTHPTRQGPVLQHRGLSCHLYALILLGCPTSDPVSYECIRKSSERISTWVPQSWWHNWSSWFQTCPAPDVVII